MAETRKKVLIAMSGGVDSSVAARLLQEAGYDCHGCTMALLPEETERGAACGALRDRDDAARVCAAMGVEHSVFDGRSAFRRQVMEPFAKAYEAGETPNPCVLCNRSMKFGLLYEEAQRLGCDLLATGHYARIVQEKDRFVLCKAADRAKDQSYVLYAMTQEMLSRTLFPLGEMTKESVREKAKELSLVTAAKRESQDICFVPDGDYASVIRKVSGRTSKPGDFVDTAGRVLGRHKGIVHYTIGQRRGLGLSLPASLYVLAIDAAANRVILGEDRELYSAAFTVDQVNWIAGKTPEEPVRCAVKVRYRQAEQPATVTPLDGGRAGVVFDEPQRALTPGQSAVFYDGDIVLGGGIIQKDRQE